MDTVDKETGRHVETIYMVGEITIPCGRRHCPPDLGLSIAMPCKHCCYGNLKLPCHVDGATVHMACGHNLPCHVDGATVHMACKLQLPFHVDTYGNLVAHMSQLTWSRTLLCGCHCPHGMWTQFTMSCGRRHCPHGR